MVERIPANLRSSGRLRQYFEKLFPGDVYHVEVALDLSDLNTLCRKRHATRDRVEKEVAAYYATGSRPMAVVQTPIEEPHTWLLPNFSNNHTDWISWEDFFSLEFYGLQKVDALNFFIRRLIRQNEEVKELQARYEKGSLELDAELQKKLSEKTDTRAAEVFRMITSQGKKGIDSLKTELKVTAQKRTGLSGLILGQKIRPGFNAETLSTIKENNFKEEAQDEEEDDEYEYAENTGSSERRQFGTEEYQKVSEAAEGKPEKFEEVDLGNETGAGDSSQSSALDSKPETKQNKEVLNFDDIPVPLPVSALKSKLPELVKQPTIKKSASLNTLNTETSSTGIKGIVSGKHVDKAQHIAKEFGKLGWEQTKLAGTSAFKGIIEAERTLELLTFGAYYKYSSTAFVTFKSRLSQSIAYQMLLSHDGLEISPAPNPKDVLWENVTVPRSQIVSRNFITNVALTLLSFLWSSIVTSINKLSIAAHLPDNQQQNLAVIVLLVFLLILPLIFDFLARYYECMKRESEIQNSIMTRYFYYQLINVYVNVGFGGNNILGEIFAILRDPRVLIDLLAVGIPAVSLFFCNLIIVKIFAAVPIEFLRPYQTVTIQVMGKCMDKKRSTRRDLRTGVFYAWPMLYGWCYPQLLMVLMIMLTYSCISPFLMPFCTLFFAFAYLMYKYQLLYVYINEYQSGGDMWYAVFDRSIISLLFSSVTLLGYLSIQLNETYLAGPFYFMLPLPFSVWYFWRYCDHKFRKASMHLSLDFSKEIDMRTKERKHNNRSTPLDTFSPSLYRQPSLVEGRVYPEAYRREENDDVIDYIAPEVDTRTRAATISDALNEIFISPLHKMTQDEDDPIMPIPRKRLSRPGRNRRSYSIDVHRLDEDIEETEQMLEQHFNSRILPLLQDEYEEGVVEERRGSARFEV